MYRRFSTTTPRTLVIPRNTILTPRYPLLCRTLIFSEIKSEIRLPVDVRISAENLVFHNCERHFVYFALNPGRYDNLNRIFINSHPWHRDLFDRFTNFKGKVFLHENYSSLLDNPTSRQTVQLLTEDEYRKFYLSFLKEAN